MEATRHFYFAGDIFDHKDLVGNALLGRYIDQVSGDRYRCVLPQDLEQSSHRAVNIRNQDLLQVMQCDVALFNFDGDDLDSGTVVEFMLAKMLDIPSVILRSDFRSAGDQNKDGDDWNLMVSFYPRVDIVQVNGMAWYQAAKTQDVDVRDALDALYTPLAGDLIRALDRACDTPSLIKGNVDKALRLYRWARTFPGSGMANGLSDEALENLVKRKAGMGLLG
ncbi:MAG: nucleoside 2-deoxyribosyltransferase [Pseudomonadota bacterium]